MSKKARRRPARIEHPKQPQLDDELQELAVVLDEHRLEANAENWFSVPWRDGWNAVALASDFYGADDYTEVTSEERHIWKWLETVIEKRDDRSHIYWEATEYLQQCTRFETKYLSAALRCLQVLLANSSGGGTVYNAILKAASDKLVPIQLHSDIILEYRCCDAIGTTSVMQNDQHDRLRRAFVIAWQRGLYQAAYSLRPVKTSDLSATKGHA